MSDLIGRFLSFEEHLGRGLVKFAYYVALFYLIVIHLFAMIDHLISLEIIAFLLVPFWFLLWLLALRVGAEFLIAVLSIDDTLRGATQPSDGFESGLTPTTPARPYREPAATQTPATAATPAPSRAPETTVTEKPAPATAEPAAAKGDTEKAASPISDAPAETKPATSEPDTKSVKRPATKRTSRKSTKKATPTSPSGQTSTTPDEEKTTGSDSAQLNGGPKSDDTPKP